MGTHMWTSAQVSRRGRRMSLELPRPPIPLTAKDSEFLQRRPDLFYPYLQAPFNGKLPHSSMGMENGLLRTVSYRFLFLSEITSYQLIDSRIHIITLSA